MDNSNPYKSGLKPKDQLKEALIQAKSENKNVLMQIGGNWCGWCIILHQLFKGDNEVKSTLDSKFVCIKIEDIADKGFVKKWAPGLTSYPWLSIVSPDGKLLTEQRTGFLEEGRGYNKILVLQFLNGGKIDSKGNCKSNWL